MTIASTPRRNRAVVALWRAYHGHAGTAKDARSDIESWATTRRALESAIETHDKAAMECLDILSQVGEDVSKIPKIEDIETLAERDDK